MLSGGTAEGTIVAVSGGQIIGPGGVAIDADVVSGMQLVSTGGIASLTVLDGGAQIIISGGDVSNTVIRGGEQVISFGGHAENTTLSGGEQLVSYGGRADGVTISAGFQLVSNAGHASDTTVEGGYQLISQAGNAVSTTVLNGGIAEVAAYGRLSAATAASGGYVFVSAAGTALDTQVDSGGVLIVVSSGGALGTVISGGSVVSTGIVVYAPGSGFAFSGNRVSRLTIGSGGSAYVLSGATAVSTVVSGGVDAVWGSALDTQVTAGGAEFVGGVATSTTVSDGDQYVSSGGIASATVIATSGTMVIESGGTAAGGITFGGSAGTLDIDGNIMPTAPISGFGTTDGIGLLNVVFSSGGTVTVTSGGALTVTENGSSYQLTLAGDYSSSSFGLTALNSGTGTLVTLACFAAGTLIATPAGDVAVEALRPGDVVSTVTGEALPVRWLGHRHVDCRRHPQPEAVRPVLIGADAFGRGMPSRPLVLSPDHAIFAEGVLIPIKHLINGSSIRQLEVASITYFHIELPITRWFWRKACRRRAISTPAIAAAFRARPWPCIRFGAVSAAMPR